MQFNADDRNSSVNFALRIQAMSILRDESVEVVNGGLYTANSYHNLNFQTVTIHCSSTNQYSQSRTNKVRELLSCTVGRFLSVPDAFDYLTQSRNVTAHQNTLNMSYVASRINILLRWYMAEYL